MGTLRIAFTVIFLSLLAGGCSTLPGTEREDTQARAGSVRLATEAPGEGYTEMRSITGYAEGECQSPLADEHRAEALADLRQRAAATGADHVKVIGSGALAERGFCATDIYRVSGIGYRLEATADEAHAGESEAGDGAEVEAPETPSPETAGDTAEKLRELEALREQDLVSESEYERLRERILDEAF